MKWGLFSSFILPEVAQALLGTVNMTLRKSVIIRFCMAWDYNDRAK